MEGLKRLQSLYSFNYEINLLKRYIPDIFDKGTVFDVGCNDGSFSNALRQYGIDSIGIDSNKEAIKIGQRFGLNLFYGKFDKNDITNDIHNVDMVSFRESLYYMDLIESLKLTKNLLKQNGIIYIKSLSPKSLYFSKGKSQKERCGNSMIKLCDYIEVIEILNSLGFTIIYKGYYPENIFRTLNIDYADTLPLKVIGRILRPIVECFNFSDRYIIIAQRNLLLK
jgi:SAM-dependent methyltransferase